MVVTAVVVKYHFSTSNHNIESGCFDSLLVVKYHFSTSNHNQWLRTSCVYRLSNIIFLHQTTTTPIHPRLFQRCQISFFYIKPQLILDKISFLTVVKYHFSTSNHNISDLYLRFIIVVKYHFSTSNHNLISLYSSNIKLSNIIFLHQTTTYIA